MTDPAHYDLRRVHLIGIGGSGMSGLARILATRGAVVTGSDVKDSTPVEVLRTMGATQSSILRIFLMAGASIGAAGTLTGFAIGALFCIYITPIQDFVEFIFNVEVFKADQYFLSKLPADIEWPEVAGIVFWSLLASVLATIRSSSMTATRTFADASLFMNLFLGTGD